MIGSILKLFFNDKSNPPSNSVSNPPPLPLARRAEPPPLPGEAVKAGRVSQQFPREYRVGIQGNLARKSALFSKAEGRFFAVLYEAVGNRALLMGKVRLWDLMDARRGLSRVEKQSVQGRIKQKHVDYVVVERETFRVVCGIELDDRTHEKEDVKSRDADKNDFFAEAGIPLLRFPTAKEYKAQEIAEKLRAVGLV